VGVSSLGEARGSSSSAHRSCGYIATRPVSLRSAVQVAAWLAETKAEDVVVIDVRGRCDFTDSMVLGTVRSERQARQSASGLLYRMRQLNPDSDAGGGWPRLEGDPGSDWMLVDAGTAVADAPPYPAGISETDRMLLLLRGIHNRIFSPCCECGGWFPT
jgi:ribosomal silencing factor RsfS